MTPITHRDSDALRRAELAGFLRSRRERISPNRAGVPIGGRRRTPGLRREEVAQLAGVGVTWYTWLEQGRDIKVSDHVLDAISRTLLLDRDERKHLFTLAGSADHASERDTAAVPPGILALLEQLSPFPVCVQNGKYDLLAYNPTYGRMVLDLDSIAVEEQNCLWQTFTNPDWRKGIVNWEVGAARMVAQFRAQMASHMADPSWKATLRRLKANSPEFAALWERHEVSAVYTNQKKVRNPWVGQLSFESVSTWLDPSPGMRMIVWTPVDAQTRRRLDTLAGMIEAGQCA